MLLNLILKVISKIFYMLIKVHYFRHRKLNLPWIPPLTWKNSNWQEGGWIGGTSSMEKSKAAVKMWASRWLISITNFVLGDKGMQNKSAQVVSPFLFFNPYFYFSFLPFFYFKWLERGSETVNWPHLPNLETNIRPNSAQIHLQSWLEYIFWDQTWT